MIFGIVMLIKNIAELIYINRGRRSFEQFHAETEQMIYDYCMKNNMTRDQFFDKMSESLNNKDMSEMTRAMLWLMAHKPYYRCKKPEVGFTRVYECDLYKCDAHPRSCFFCDHCTDIMYDGDGPYNFTCTIDKDPSKGFLGECESFKEDLKQ